MKSRILNFFIQPEPDKMCGDVRRGGRKESGLSLVELMVAMAIGLFLVAVIGSIFVGAKQTYRTQDNLARLQENGRFAIDLLGRNIREAGYTQISFDPPALLYDKPSATTFSGTAIAGTNGTNGTPDTITVSYDSTTDCLNAHPPGGRVVNMFWVDNDSKQLMCHGNGGDDDGVMLLDDVEDMQILYGENLGSTHRFVPAGTAGLVMGNVDSVRVCVLLRTPDEANANPNQAYVNCKGVVAPAADKADKYIRRAYSATLNLRNRTP